MKSKVLTVIMLLMTSFLAACPVCEANQPKGLENITHGEGPQGNIDYIIMYSAIIIVTYTLIMSIKYLVRPKESKHSDIKNIVVQD